MISLVHRLTLWLAITIALLLSLYVNGKVSYNLDQVEDESFEQDRRENVLVYPSQLKLEINST